MNLDRELNQPSSESNLFMQLNKILKKWSALLVPLLYIGISIVITVYNVENPTDSLTERWLSYNNVLGMTWEMVLLVVLASVGAVITSVPLGILITRPSFKWLAPIVDAPVNVGQTVPSLAIIALSFTFLGIGFQTALFALWLYSLLPILRNTSIGLQSVDKGVLESAKGMGMTPLRIFTKIEFPLALPVIMAGVRTAMVICTGAATLATFIGAGGLGDLIVTGLSMARYQIVFVGAGLSALLALIIDNLLGTLENRLLSRS